MELRQLKYFVRIVEVGSISRASQSLHVAQPALSQQINHLEEELGVKLLARSARGVTPTEAGSAVYRQAQLILKQVETTRLLATQADSGPAGPVAIGLPWTVTSLLGLALLDYAHNNLRSVRLEITEGPSAVLADLLSHGKLDLAVVFDNAVDSGLSMKPIVVEQLFFIGPRGSLAKQSDITAVEAAAYPLLLLSRPNGIREVLERLWADAGVRPPIVAEINAPRLLSEAVQAGLGYSVLPACGIEEALQSGKLDALPLESGRITRTVFLSTSRLFALSRATEHMYAVVEQLARAAVSEGRWNARVLPESDCP